MLKITKINVDKLKEAGFEETECGACKEIPNCFRHYYTLYISSDEIYGTITGRAGSDKVLDFEEWLNDMCFRTPEKRDEVIALLAELKANGAIEYEEVTE